MQNLKKDGDFGDVKIKSVIKRKSWVEYGVFCILNGEQANVLCTFG